MPNIKNSVYFFQREIKQMLPEKNVENMNVADLYESEPVISFKEKAPKAFDCKIMFPFYLQLALFIMGLFGLRALVISFSLTYSNYQFSNIYSILVNYSSYAFLGLFMLVACFIEFDEFKKKNNNPYSFLIGIPFGIALIGVTALLTIIISRFYKVEDNANETLVVSVISISPILSIIFLGIVGPFCEEMTYRVGLLSLLSRKGRLLAYIISSLIFALIHFDFGNIGSANEWMNLPMYIASGLLLSFVYDRYGFGASFVAHCVNNLTSVIVNLIG